MTITSVKRRTLAGCCGVISPIDLSVRTDWELGVFFDCWDTSFGMVLFFCCCFIM